MLEAVEHEHRSSRGDSRHRAPLATDYGMSWTPIGLRPRGRFRRVLTGTARELHCRKRILTGKDKPIYAPFLPTPAITSRRRDQRREGSAHWRQGVREALLPSFRLPWGNSAATGGGGPGQTSGEARRGGGPRYASQEQIGPRPVQKAKGLQRTRPSAPSAAAPATRSQGCLPSQLNH